VPAITATMARMISTAPSGDCFEAGADTGGWLRDAVGDGEGLGDALGDGLWW
jgi:hypothetical protein